MDLTRYVVDLQHRLTAAADAMGDDARDLAGRLSAPLDAALRLVLLDALSTAAGEISADLAPGSVDLRLRGGEPEFVVDPARAVGEPPAPSPVVLPAGDGEDVTTTRTTLRLPDRLKSQVEIAAAGDGVSVNTWLVRAVAGALEQTTGHPPGAPGTRTPRGGNHLSGWVR